MSIRKITAIWKKQVKDTLKNKEVLIQFIMFPILTLIMQSSIKMEGVSERYFIILFATMYVGMAPLTSIASIIAEEKEKNTLRVLLMSNVKAYEYLWGIGIYIFMCCMFGAAVFGIAGKYQGIEFFYFILIMGSAVLISLLIGALIGIISKSQMAATSITVPVMLVFSFLPMLSMFNDKIGVVSKFTYSQQFNNLLQTIGVKQISYENVLIILCNFILFLVLFGLAYRKYGLN